MRNIVRITAGSRSLLLALLVVPLLSCSGGEPEQSAASAPSAALTEQTVTGLAVEANLTACGMVDDKPGTCEGALVLEVKDAEAAERITLEVTRDIELKKAGQSVFLPQLQGSQITATYRTLPDGTKIATSVNAS